MYFRFLAMIFAGVEASTSWGEQRVMAVDWICQALIWKIIPLVRKIGHPLSK
jgi:hypothetical protein